MLRLWPVVGPRHDPQRTQDAPAAAAPPRAGDGWDALEMIRVPPGGRVPRRPCEDTEVVTYVREGAVAYEDSTARLLVTCAGEFSWITSGPGVRWTATNASTTEWAQLFQISLVSPTAGREPGCAHKRFSLAERRDKLCLIASRDGREGSLRIHRDAQLFSAVASAGQHLVHELPPGSSAWLHVVVGEVTLGELVLLGGEGAGVSTERAVSFTAREDSEVLLLDLDSPERPAFYSEPRGR